MTEDDNEGVFGVPPPTGNFIRVGSVGDDQHAALPADRRTRSAGGQLSDAALAAIVEKDGLGKHLPWVGGQPTLTAHPLSSCRMGDDPTLSALDDRARAARLAGLFVTDGSSVPTSLTRQPVAHDRGTGRARLGRHPAARASDIGIDVHMSVPPPGN